MASQDFDLDLDKKLPMPNDKSPTEPRLVRALRAFEEAAGGREAIVAELATATLSEQETLLVRLLADPDRDHQPIHELLGYAQLSVARFLRLFRDARGARAYLDALDKVWQKLPDVAEDVMTRALPKQVTCKACDGSGFQRISATKDRNLSGPLKDQMERVHCPDCSGTGLISQAPTLDYQKLALTLGGLPKPIPGTLVDNSKTQINAQQQNFYGSDTMKDFISAVQGLKYGPRHPAPLEAEVVEEEKT